MRNSLSPVLFTPWISILIIELSPTPDTAQRPNFIVPVEFPALGRYVKPLPTDKSLSIDKLLPQFIFPIHETLPLSTVKISVIVSGLRVD